MIETERLLLRRPRLEDAEAIVGMYSDPEVMRFIGGVQPGLDTREVVRRWLERWDANGFGNLVVERREDGMLLGRIVLLVWDTSEWRPSTLPDAGEHAQPELGWGLDRSAWGYGYATEAALAARAWARDELRIGRLISLIAPENVRSRRVAEKLGCVAGEEVVLSDHGPAVVWEHPC